MLTLFVGRVSFKYVVEETQKFVHLQVRRKNLRGKSLGKRFENHHWGLREMSDHIAA